MPPRRSGRMQPRARALLDTHDRSKACGPQLIYSLLAFGSRRSWIEETLAPEMSTEESALPLPIGCQQEFSRTSERATHGQDLAHIPTKCMPTPVYFF